MTEGQGIKITEDKAAEIVRRYRAGESSPRIARAVGCSKPTVLGYLRRAGVERRGATVEPRRLSDEQMPEIAEAHAAGRSLESLGAEYGVTGRCIALRLKRRGLFVRGVREALKLHNATRPATPGARFAETAADASGMKVCRSCKAKKPLTDYAQDLKIKGRRVNRCSRCQSKNLQYRQRLRAEVLLAYGGRCACCGESTPEFLGIDHIHNDGADERRSGTPTGYRFYVKLQQMGFPKDRYQLLCHNCNMAKGFYGVCPHQKAAYLRG